MKIISCILSGMLILSMSCKKQTNCEYADYLNPNTYATQSNIEGSWVLESLVTLNDCRVETPPNSPSKIVFTDDSTVFGSTMYNTYSGKYVLIEKNIKFHNMVFTEIGEPAWGEKIAKAIGNADYVCVKNNKLIIHFEMPTGILIFKKEK